MHRKWHFKRVERQAQIAKRLEKLGKRSGLLQQLASGAFAGVVSRSFVAPLDLIKTHLVTGHGSRGAPKTAAVVAAKIFEEGGWKAFFRGNGINCLRVAPCKAIELCVFENLKRALSKDEGSLMSFVAAPVAGGAAGMMSTVATYPLELMRTRMMVQPHLYTSISRTFHKIVAEEGAGALYSGLRPSVLGVFPYAAANYGVYAGLRSAYKRVTKKDYVPTVPTLLFGAAAASCSSALTFPLEVARRQMQLGTVGGKAVYKNALDVVQTIYKEEGFLALYRGLGTTCVKLIPAAAVSCMCYEAARLALRVDDASIKKRENEKEALKEEEEGLALQAEVE
ncbi:mitochondrial substrate carrier family protein [Klebsormidium nitens]|uniref:Mitochondrial substrate carrier family protein n=1 Tax=Klebsormidium nitens TaxID=105231 RepID=A0A1Y1HJD3_KLENI|nr:mitochondrial substrate carrier family protein [Klebsormidium nitens]|eukprot:GAQ78624.1 mitochondrial substrate carrier family protein [Klebsormidium nitens]